VREAARWADSSPLSRCGPARQCRRRGRSDRDVPRGFASKTQVVSVGLVICLKVAEVWLVVAAMSDVGQQAKSGLAQTRSALHPITEVSQTSPHFGRVKGAADHLVAGRWRGPQVQSVELKRPTHPERFARPCVAVQYKKANSITSSAGAMSFTRGCILVCINAVARKHKRDVLATPQQKSNGE
jgi:hypothetical protein